MTNTNKKTILVTGGSGYIAMFIMIALLKKGYRVRATLRTMSRQEEVKKMMAQGGISDFSDLDFVQTDLTKEEGWSQAMTGVDSVIHVASPTPLQRPDADDLMVKMAVDGVKFVMKAAKEAGVKRVVLTSASGAVLAGHKHHPEIFTEKDWTNLDAPINAYQRSKTMAEDEAIGQRFIATSGQNITYKKQAEFLKKEFGTKAKKVSTQVIPDFLVKILARFDKSLAMPATFLGQNTACSNEKSVKLLGWKPRSGEAAIIQTAQTMLDLGVIKVD